MSWHRLPHFPSSPTIHFVGMIKISRSIEYQGRGADESISAGPSCIETGGARSTRNFESLSLEVSSSLLLELTGHLQIISSLERLGPSNLL